MNYLTEFKIQQLRTKNLTAAVESISAVTGAVVANMLIPQLLLKYVYVDTSQLLEAPAVFTYLPLVTYSVALAYFVYAMIGNFLRNRKANALEQELALTGGCCSDGCCSDGSCDCDDSNEEISDSELKELEKIVDAALKPNTKKSTKAAKKKTSKKTK